MINEIKVIDNVIPKSYQDILENTLIKNNGSFPWYFMNNLTKSNFDSNDIYGFIHVYNNFRTNYSSEYFNLLLPFMHQACEKIDFNIQKIYLGRSFLTLPALMQQNSLWHTDLEDIDHLVFLYYVNDSDGDTLFSNLTNKEITASEIKNKDVEVIKNISPKKGRGVFFNGNIYHASTNPTNGPRCVINFDLG